MDTSENINTVSITQAIAQLAVYWWKVLSLFLSYALTIGLIKILQAWLDVYSSSPYAQWTKSLHFGLSIFEGLCYLALLVKAASYFYQLPLKRWQSLALVLRKFPACFRVFAVIFTFLMLAAIGAWFLLHPGTLIATLLGLAAILTSFILLCYTSCVFPLILLEEFSAWAAIKESFHLVNQRRSFSLTFLVCALVIYAIIVGLTVWGIFLLSEKTTPSLLEQLIILISNILLSSLSAAIQLVLFSALKPKAVPLNLIQMQETQSKQPT